MKTTRLITFCSILLFSSQTFSQETVNTGFGISGFGNVEVDVPEEEQSSDDQSEESTNESNGNNYSDDGFDGGYITTNNISWKVSTLSPQEKLSLIIIVCGEEKDRIEQPNGRIPARSQVNPSEKFRAVVNGQDKVTSANRPERSNRYDWECPNKGKCDGDCRNQSDRNRPRTCDKGKTNEKETAKWKCDCCCHTSSSGDSYTTQNSGGWGNDDNRPDSNGNDDNSWNEGNHANGQSQTTCDNKSNGIQEGRSRWNDDCECSCNCRLLAGLLFYD